MPKDYFNRSVWRLAAAVFAVCALLRLALDLVFRLHFGARATTYLETWFYTAVMMGVKLPGGGIMDPTVWLLRAAGALTPSGLEFYCVILLSAALSSVSAVLIFLLVSELYEKRTAFAAALVWSGLPEPLGLSMYGFTHDIVQIPLMLACMLCAVKAVKDGPRRALWAGAFVFVVYNSRFVNGNIWVAVASVGAYAGYQLVCSLFAGRGGMKPAALYSAYMAFMLVAMVVLGRTVFFHAIEQTLESLPQGRAGSQDVIPLSLLVFWLRDNILLFLLPFGALAAYRRRDVLFVTLAMSGLAVASVMSRGTRISDLGLAVIFAFALADWDLKEPYGMFSRKERLKTTVVFSAALFLLMSFMTSAKPGYTAVFLAGGAGILYCLWRFRADERLFAVVSAAVLCGAGSTVVFIYTVNAGDMGSQAEYDMLQWLADNNGGGKILISWDHGYMAETIAGLESVSTPNRVDADVHNLLWMPQRQAAVGLYKAGVRYVLIKSGDFAVVEDSSGRQGYGYLGIVFPPKNTPTVKVADMITAYQLLHTPTGGYFRLIRRLADGASGQDIFLYEVDVQPTGQELNGSLVGGIVENFGHGRTFTVKASAYAAGQTHSGVFNETFGAGEVREVLYPVEPFGVGYNCTLSTSPSGEAWSSVGGEYAKAVAVFC